jgi:hypothetical protein
VPAAAVIPAPIAYFSTSRPYSQARYDVGPLASFVCSVMLFTILKPPFLARSSISTCPLVEYRCESEAG